MKTFAHYLKSSKRGTGFLHGLSGQRITMWISVWSTRPISVFLGASMVCRDILLLQFCLLALVALVFGSRNLLPPLVKRWRSMSHSSFVYLDDWFDSQPDQCSAAAAAVIQERELNSSDFLVNEDNPIGIPCKLANGWVS